MKKLFLLFSHKLNDIQIENAKKNYKVEEFVYLPPELQKQWSSFDSGIEVLQLKPFKNLLQMNSEKDDIVLIQGDFGATHSMVNFSKKLGLTPVYATTKRVSHEYKNSEGEIVKESIFKFGRFREYE